MTLCLDVSQVIAIYLLGAASVSAGVFYYVHYTDPKPDDGVRELARQKLNEK